MSEVFSEQELAFLRHARFGELPDRVTADELVQSVETDARRDLPEPVGDPQVWRDLYAGG
jgi:hypothetical protein